MHIKLQVNGPGRKTWQTKGEEQEAAGKEFIEIMKVLEAAGREALFWGRGIWVGGHMFDHLLLLVLFI